MNKPKLLMLNGSVNEIELIRASQKLGYYVITTGNAPELIGHKYADEYIKADYSDCDAILALAKGRSISRVVSCANDFGAITASYVAEQLDLPGHDTYENALTLHHKDRFKQFIQQLGIKTPESVVLKGEAEALAYAAKAEYPIMVKATDLTGGKGVHRADNFTEAKKAIKDALDRSRVDIVIIEPYITGRQQSAVAFIKDCKILELVSCDCYMPLNPYLIQSETLPANGFEIIEPKVRHIITSICERLELKDGIFILQYIVSNNEPYVIEMMRRAPGNQFLRAARAVSGFPWEEAVVKAETGASLNDIEYSDPIAPFAGHHGIMGTKNGKISGYYIDPDFKKHIFHIIEMMHVGDEITDCTNERVAYIYYKFEQREEMDHIAKHFNNLAYVIYK